MGQQAQVAHFAPKEPNHGNYGTTEKTWALIFIFSLIYLAKSSGNSYINDI